MAFIGKLIGAAGGLFLTVIARDWGTLVPRDEKGSLVFDEMFWFSPGSNSLKRLDAILPKCSFAEASQAPQHRLERLRNAALPIVEKMIQPVRDLLPPQVLSPQSFSHQLCDSQQLRRENQKSGRPRRNIDELKRYAAIAIPLFFERANVELPGKLAAPSVSPRSSPQISSADLLPGSSHQSFSADLLPRSSPQIFSQAVTAQVLSEAQVLSGDTRLAKRSRVLRRGVGSEPWDMNSSIGR